MLTILYIAAALFSINNGFIRKVNQRTILSEDGGNRSPKQLGEDSDVVIEEPEEEITQIEGML